MILATISIQSLTNTGLFAKAQEARDKTQNAVENQAKTLNEYEDELNKYISGNIEEKKITGNIRAGWLFHLLHCRLWIENTEIHYNIRLLGIKIKSSETKEKKKNEKV